MNFETNVGPPIKDVELEKLIKEFIEKMKTISDFESADYLTMVRIYNTIQSNKLSEKQQMCKEFAELFQSQYVSKAISSLEASLTKGMAWYSQKYNVYIGGRPHENSQFKLGQL